jgi:hypothetical protein
VIVVIVSFPPSPPPTGPDTPLPPRSPWPVVDKPDQGPCGRLLLSPIRAPRWSKRSARSAARPERYHSPHRPGSCASPVVCRANPDRPTSQSLTRHGIFATKGVVRGRGNRPPPVSRIQQVPIQFSVTVERARAAVRLCRPPSSAARPVSAVADTAPGSVKKQSRMPEPVTSDLERESSGRWRAQTLQGFRLLVVPSVPRSLPRLSLRGAFHPRAQQSNLSRQEYPMSRNTNPSSPYVPASVPVPTVESSPRSATAATGTPRRWRSVKRHSARRGCGPTLRQHLVDHPAGYVLKSELAADLLPCLRQAEVASPFVSASISWES